MFIWLSNLTILALCRLFVNAYLEGYYRYTMQHSNPNLGSQPVEQVVQRVVRADDVIDLRYLFRSWWKGSWFIILAALAGLAIGLWEMKKFQPMYTAVMLVSPAGGPEGGSSRDISGLQSFAAAFGIGSGSAAGGATSSFDRLIVLLGSVTLAERLQERHSFLQTVYRGAWNPSTQDWNRPSGTRFERMEALREYFKLPTWKPPSISSLASFIGSTVRVVTLQANGFRQVSVAHEDPEFAEYLLRTAYYEADELLREIDQESTRVQKQYLENKIANSKIIEIRTGLVGLLMQQENKAMLLQSDAPYAAYIIQPISVSNRPTAPNPRMYVGVGVVVGAFIGLLVVSFISMFRRET